MFLDPDRPFLISPPFGTYFSDRRAYSVLGSFTAEPRPGRTGQVLRTVRPVPHERGPAWINKVGLRNPGIASLARFGVPGHAMPRDEIVSLSPLEGRDWGLFEQFLDEAFGPLRVEFNVSCPNVDEHPSLPPLFKIRRLLANCPDAIWKLPPTRRALDSAALLHDAGARYVHLSNTIPSPVGGISGTPLRELNLPLVEAVARALPSLEVVAGGGIYHPDHVRQYRDAGAVRFSLATSFFWPPRARRILEADVVPSAEAHVIADLVGRA